jgi:Gluconate 2-dehydrogenase subunit 3
MEPETLSRRAILQALAATLGAAALPVGWTDIALAAQDTHAAATHATGTATAAAFFSAADAADVEAIAAQIIPTDDTPGAREAGVIHFIDRALSTYLPQLAPNYRTQLAAFQADVRRQHPTAASFASLPSDQQIAYLKTVDRTPFFTTTRLLTLLGMFSLPAYGGNRDGIGWTLIGFEDRHAFQPPFGYYDRDYPGFAVDPIPTK